VDSVIIEVAVTDPDPRQAARIADAVGTELAKAAGEMTPSREDGSEAVRGTTIAVAQVPTSPSSLLDRLRRLAH
jgi:capsular polysaccharide biosynthesis protein